MAEGKALKDMRTKKELLKDLKDADVNFDRCKEVARIVDRQLRETENALHQEQDRARELDVLLADSSKATKLLVFVISVFFSQREFWEVTRAGAKLAKLFDHGGDFCEAEFKRALIAMGPQIADMSLMLTKSKEERKAAEKKR